MRKLLTWTLLFGLLGLVVLNLGWGASGGASAETVAPVQRTLDVTGRGTVKVAYDTAAITLGINQLAETPAGAYRSMSKSMNSVVAAIKGQGIKEEELKTGYLNLDAQYDWRDGTQTLKGYRAVNTIVITTSALDKVADLIETAIDAGANQLVGLQFSVRDPNALLNQALDLAVDNARSNADRAALRLGTEVTGVAKVVINDNGRGPIMAAPNSGAPMFKSEGAAPVFSGGNEEYTVTVQVTFTLR